MRKLLIIIPVVLILMECDSIINSENHSKKIGKIVFTANNKSGIKQIYIMDDNGTNIIQLTSMKTCDNPTFFDNGRKIIFTSGTKGISLGPAIWIMDSDGNNKNNIYLSDTANKHLPYLIGRRPEINSYDTKLIYYLYSNYSFKNDIYLYNLETQKNIKITNLKGDNIKPTWSPKGNKIAFISDMDYLNLDTLRFRQDIYVLNLNNQKLDRVTYKGFVETLLWDHSGKFIYFRSMNNKSGIYKVNLETKNISLICEDLKNGNVKIYPQSISESGNQLLISTYAPNNPDKNRIAILNICILQDKNLALCKKKV
ncbi:MAG: DPP IV N-terminal domain-containing protein [Candidatus Marinimicrobia bacterium]|nr:DPP IV N-terminal domain-containing protein [Candidatus Neomarinimicrobiota bacterium]